jgi:hypothetical protein
MRAANLLRIASLGLFLGGAALTGCGDDDETGKDGGSTSDAVATVDTATGDTAPAGDGGVADTAAGEGGTAGDTAAGETGAGDVAAGG